LDKPAKILIAGVLASALAYGLGQMNTRRLERRVQELQTACVAEQEAEAKKQGTLSALTTIFTGRMSCDPIELAKSSNSVGIQGQLARAELELSRWGNWPLVVCTVTLLISSAPWLWYFFLRRIRELREAILGR
jgi:hypothetical protein